MACRSICFFFFLIPLLITEVVKSQGLQEASISDEVPLDTILKEYHESLDRLRNETYGNCFLEGESRETIEQTKGKGFDHDRLDKYAARTYGFRFWSREGEYFRVDLLDSEDKLKERLIIRPEGHVLLNVQNEKLVIVDAGDANTGKSRLANYDFYQDSGRVYKSLRPESYFDPAKLEDYYQPNESIKKTHTSEWKDDRFVLTIKSSTLNANSKVRLLLRKTQPNVVTAFESNSELDGDFFNKLEKTLTYSPSIGSDRIPIRVEETRINTDDATRRTTTITKVDLTLQPLELFSLEAQGFRQERVWIRRLVILAVSLLILGTYFAYRRSRT